MNETRSPAAARRSSGRLKVARALWYAAPGKVEIRAAPLKPPAPGEALVRALFSGVSRGTERLVSQGAIGKSEWERMRAPLQDGTFPFPVKYGYCAVGIVETGPAELRARPVFCLHPHQDYFIAPVPLLVPIPQAVPPRRATLAATMETALNAIWDSGAGPADRIVVIGAGVVGLLVAYLATRLPGAEVTIVDPQDARVPIAQRLGLRIVKPDETPGDADIVVHASATGEGLAAALTAAGLEARVIELSWYGERQVQAPLGGAFHSRRLTLASSQVGHVAPSRRPRWTHRRRLEAALKLLDDAALDCLVAEEIAFETAPAELPKILAATAGALSPVIRY